MDSTIEINDRYTLAALSRVFPARAEPGIDAVVSAFPYSELTACGRAPE
jgi:hypothetical protein